MQGKMPNASTDAGLYKALANSHVKALLSVVGQNHTTRRFAKVLLLCDADADGLHARMLLCLFFRRYLSHLISDGIVFNVYPPLYQKFDPSSRQTSFGWNGRESQSAGSDAREITYFKGIAGMSSNALAHTCLNSETRADHPLTADDAA